MGSDASLIAARVGNNVNCDKWTQSSGGKGVTWYGCLNLWQDVDLVTW